MFSSSFTFVRIRGQFEAKGQLRSVIWGEFQVADGCARLWLQVLYRTALHNFNVFRLLLTKGAHFKQNQSCA